MSADLDEKLFKLCKMRCKHLMEARLDKPSVCLCSCSSETLSLKRLCELQVQISQV